MKSFAVLRDLCTTCKLYHKIRSPPTSWKKSPLTHDALHNALRKTRVHTHAHAHNRKRNHWNITSNVGQRNLISNMHRTLGGHQIPSGDSSRGEQNMNSMLPSGIRRGTCLICMYDMQAHNSFREASKSCSRTETKCIHMCSKIPCVAINMLAKHSRRATLRANTTRILEKNTFF